ncbi:MAG: InlB B-repeat-containing protein [Erysipelotrichaceae bacterium]|nr:InlB B-repeat-containing protein [Erysipelotrichaceae bacterium]
MKKRLTVLIVLLFCLSTFVTVFAKEASTSMTGDKVELNDLDNQVEITFSLPAEDYTGREDYVIGFGVFTDQISEYLDFVYDAYGDHIAFEFYFAGEKQEVTYDEEDNYWYLGEMVPYENDDGEIEYAYEYAATYDEESRQMALIIAVPVISSEPIQLKYKLEWNMTGPNDELVDTSDAALLYYIPVDYETKTAEEIHVTEAPLVKKEAPVLKEEAPEEDGDIEDMFDTMELVSPQVRFTQMATVTFDLNGHGKEAIDDQKVMPGETAQAPADPTDDEYTFDGWYTEAKCKNLYDFSTPVTEDITLYAKWVPQTPPTGGPETLMLGILMMSTSLSGMTQIYFADKRRKEEEQ